MTASKVSMTALQSGAILAVVLQLPMLALLPTTTATTVSTVWLHNVHNHPIGRTNSNRSNSTECQCPLLTVSLYALWTLVTH